MNGVANTHCKIEFIKHVFPIFLRPGGGPRSLWVIPLELLPIECEVNWEDRAVEPGKP